MALSLIWIDREEANLFNYKGADLVDRRRFHSTDAGSVYAEVGAAVDAEGDILILGPDVTKYHFHNYLTEHLPAIARKVISFENGDPTTDGELKEFLSKCLKESFRKKDPKF